MGSGIPGLCIFCGTVQRLTRHHIKPKSKGGTNSRENLILLCRPCHDIADQIAGVATGPRKRNPPTVPKAKKQKPIRTCASHDWLKFGKQVMKDWGGVVPPEQQGKVLTRKWAIQGWAE